MLAPGLPHRIRRMRPTTACFTAADAYMRDFKLAIPRDCVGAKTADARRRALEAMTELLGARTTASPRIRLGGARARGRSR
jgi:hypothetical protein